MNMDSICFLTDGAPEYAHGLKILLFDHDTDSLKHTASVLEHYSFNVAAIQQASEALSLISEQNNSFELVMANTNMSDSDSVSFLHTLLEKDIRVILMSSEINDDLMRKALDKGASFLLQKPIPLEDLKNVWQHVYWKINPMKDIGEENCEEWMDWLDDGTEMNEESEVFGPSFGGIKTKEDNALCRPDTGHDLNGSGLESDLEDINSYSTEEFFPTENSQQKTSGKKHSADNTLEQGRMKRSKPTGQQTDSDSIARYQEGIIEKNEKPEKKRIVWTSDLHYKFTAAISVLGDEKARPKAILNMMGVKEVTMRQVASHLQKYKNQVRRIYQNAGIFNGRTSLSNSSSWNQGTSRFGGGGSATPSSWTRSSISTASFNNHDYRMQNRNSSREGLSRYGNHDTNCPNDSLRTGGLFQPAKQIQEKSTLECRNELIEYLNRRQRLGSEESTVKVTETLPSMTSEVDSPNVSTNTLQLPNQPSVVHQEHYGSPALIEPSGSRKQEQVLTKVHEQQNMNLPSRNYSTPEAYSPYILENAYQFPNELSVVTQKQKYTPVASDPIHFEIEDKFSFEDEPSELVELMPMNLPSMSYKTSADTSANQEKYYASANSTSSGTLNSFSTEVAGINELLDFLLDSPGKEYTTDGDASTQISENAVQLPKEPLDMGLEQVCTPGLNGYFGTQFENKSSERITELEFLEKGTPSYAANNLGNLPGDFNNGSQKMEISSNEHQPLSEYADLLKMLEDESEEYNSFGNAPYAGTIDDHFRWLEETLFADSTEEH